MYKVPIPLLACAVCVVSAVAIAATVGAQPQRPAAGPGSISTGSTLPATRADDPRPHLNESRLQDINSQLESDRPESPTLPAPARPDFSGKPASVSTGSTAAAVESELRGNLHRLQRETREQASPHSRTHVIEESLHPDP